MLSQGEEENGGEEEEEEVVVEEGQEEGVLTLLLVESSRRDVKGRGGRFPGEGGDVDGEEDEGVGGGWLRRKAWVGRTKRTKDRARGSRSMGSKGRDDDVAHGGERTETRAALALVPRPLGHGTILDLCFVVMRVDVRRGCACEMRKRQCRVSNASRR